MILVTFCCELCFSKVNCIWNKDSLCHTLSPCLCPSGSTLLKCSNYHHNSFHIMQASAGKHRQQQLCDSSEVTVKKNFKVANFIASRLKRARVTKCWKRAISKRAKRTHHWPTLSGNLFMPAAKLVPQCVGSALMTMTDMIPFLFSCCCWLGSVYVVVVAAVAFLVVGHWL